MYSLIQGACSSVKIEESMYKCNNYFHETLPNPAGEYYNYINFTFLKVVAVFYKKL